MNIDPSPSVPTSSRTEEGPAEGTPQMKRRLVSHTIPAGPAEHDRADAMATLVPGTECTTGTRPTRWHALIAATTVAVGVLAVITVASSPGRNSSAATPTTAITEIAASNAGALRELSAGDGLGSSPASAPPTNCADRASSAAECSSIRYLSLPTSNIPPSPCRNLIFAAAEALGADPANWIVSLIASNGNPGQTIDQAIHDRLVMVRDIVVRANASDPRRTSELDALNAVIADAATQPCSSADPGVEHSLD